MAKRPPYHRRVTLTVRVTHFHSRAHYLSVDVTCDDGTAAGFLPAVTDLPVPVRADDLDRPMILVREMLEEALSRSQLLDEFPEVDRLDEIGRRAPD